MNSHLFGRLDGFLGVDRLDLKRDRLDLLAHVEILNPHSNPSRKAEQGRPERRIGGPLWFTDVVNADVQFPLKEAVHGIGDSADLAAGPAVVDVFLGYR